MQHSVLLPSCPCITYLIALILIIICTCRGISGATFTLINGCEFTIWPGILANAGSSPLESTGFELGPGASLVLHSPVSWSGRIWGRTGCYFDPATGQGSCRTGDCGSGHVECDGAAAQPPATLAEFTVGSASGTGQDFYDVSLVDGYNLPLVVEASGSSGSCLPTGCIADLNRGCPAELRYGSDDGCRSACEAFGSPEYCCSGAYASPGTCKPSVYSQMFKAACPRSYSYAFDDATSTFTCTAADYTIAFCPSLSASQKSATPNGSSSTGTMTPTGSGASGSNYMQSPSGGSYPAMYPWSSGFVTGDAPARRDLTLLFVCIFYVIFITFLVV
ncbi:hypothetical protein SAY86_011042 [Trapa natans]|uniref:Thaumatin-like protein 1b n=1 Tax=Trapa natans TaxID=22666 RepID=A0AAN7LLH3_TRANT|nr:hypothetical protein SAY86_011042 [Trapa natans]